MARHNVYLVVQSVTECLENVAKCVYYIVYTGKCIVLHAIYYLQCHPVYCFGRVAIVVF